VPYKFLFYVLIYIAYIAIGPHSLLAGTHQISSIDDSHSALTNPENKNVKITEEQKFKQRARLERTLASDMDNTSSRTKVVSYLIVLFLPLLVGFWLMKKKGL
jgi:hypothetical protein